MYLLVFEQDRQHFATVYKTAAFDVYADALSQFDTIVNNNYASDDWKTLYDIDDQEGAEKRLLILHHKRTHETVTLKIRAIIKSNDRSLWWM